MPSNYFTDPLIFVIDTLFSLYILAIMLRFIFQWVRADFYNPIVRFLVKITQPPLRLLRRFLPPFGKVDTASLVLLLILAMLKLAIVSSLVYGFPPVFLLLLAGIGDLVGLLFDIFFIAILVQVVLSWVAPGSYSPAIVLLDDLTEPVLRPVRNWVPPMGGLDLSPLVALIALQVLSMLIEPLFPRII